MPTANDFFPSKYLKAEDLDADLTVVIKMVKTETLNGQNGKPDEDKPVAYFEDVDKGVILNKTNFAAIAKITGKPNSDDWNGQKVTLTVLDVDAFGDVVKAIRVKDPSESDPTVLAFWKACDDMRLSRQEGRDHLKEFGGNFAAALADLIGSDPTPTSEQLPPKN